MNDNDLEPLEPDLQSLLDSVRVPEAVPSLARQRLRQRIATSIGVPPPQEGGPVDTQDASGAAETSSGAAGASAGAASAAAVPHLARWLVAASLGAVVGAGGYALVAPRPAPIIREIPAQAPEPVVETESATERVLQAPAAAEATTGPTPESDPESPAERPGRAAQRRERSGATDAAEYSPPPPAAETSEVPDSRRAERVLITRAQTALARGRASDAVRAVDAYVEQFPEGAYREEGHALRVQALANAGRTDQARRSAATFLRRYPQSIFRAAVEPFLAR